MHDIKITSVNELDGGWLLDVAVNDNEYQVGVSRDYHQQLTGGREPVEQLIARSFEFMLEREPASTILSRFDLSTIQRYFPEYEQRISLDKK